MAIRTARTSGGGAELFNPRRTGIPGGSLRRSRPGVASLPVDFHAIERRLGYDASSKQPWAFRVARRPRPKGRGSTLLRWRTVNLGWRRVGLLGHRRRAAQERHDGDDLPLHFRPLFLGRLGPEDRPLLPRPPSLPQSSRPIARADRSPDALSSCGLRVVGGARSIRSSGWVKPAK